jgi:hypothetical protein
LQREFLIRRQFEAFLIFGETVEVILFAYTVHLCSIHCLFFECSFEWKDKGCVGTAFLATNFNTQCSVIEV